MTKTVHVEGCSAFFIPRGRTATRDASGNLQWAESEGGPCSCGAVPASSVEELKEQLAQSYIDYQDRSRKLCMRLSAELLLQTLEVFKRLIEEPGQDSPGIRSHMQERYAAFAEIVQYAIASKQISAEADEAFAQGAKAFCVYHRCDMSRCPPGSHGEEGED